MLNQLFAYDGIVSKVLQKFWKCVILSLLFLVGCIPVLTIGTSFTAMYYAMQKNVIEERGHLLEAFWKGFKGNLKQSVLTQLIFIVLALVFAQDIYFFYGQMKAGNSIGMLWILFALVMALTVLTAIYSYCYMARIENTLVQTIKDSFLIMFLQPAQNLKIVILLAANVVAVYLFPPVLPFLPPLTCFLIVKGMEKTLRKYMRGGEETMTDGTAEAKEKIVTDKTAEAGEETVTAAADEKSIGETEHAE